MRRKLIRILIVLVGLFVLLGIAVKLFVSPEAVKEFVFAELEARTGIHAEAEEASIQFPWPVGLRLKKLHLSTPEGSGSGLRLVAEVEDALATADLMSLLRKEPQVQEVRLSKPRLEIWLSDARPEAPAMAEGGEPTVVEPDAAGVALALSLLSIDEGHIVVHQADGSTSTVEGLRQRVRFQIDAAQKFSGRVETSISALRIEGGAREEPLELAELSTELLLSGVLEPLHVEATVSSFVGEGLSASGEIVYEVRDERPFVDADLEWAMDPAALLRRARAASAEQPDDPLADLELALGSISGRASFSGLLPEENNDPALWLPMLQLSGAVEGFELGAFGQAGLARVRGEFRLEGERVVLEPLELQADGAKLEGRIVVPALGMGELSGKLTMQLDTAALQKSMHAIWPALPDSVTAESTPPEEWPQLSGTLKGELWLQVAVPAPEVLPADAVRGIIGFDELTVLHESMVAPLIVREGSVSFDLERANIERLRLTTDGLEGTVEGVLDSWPETVHFVGRGAFAEVDLDRLQPEDSGLQSHSARGTMAWWSVGVAHAGAESEAFVPPENLDLQMSLQVDRLLTRGYVIRDMRCVADLSQQVLVVRDLEGRLGSGRLVGEASVDWSAESPNWKTRVEAIEVPAQALLEPVAPRLGEALQTKVSGMILLNADLSEDRDQMLQSLSGGGALKGDAGQLLTTMFLGDSLDQLPGDAAAKLRSIPFKDFLTSLRFDAGKAHFSETVLRGSTQVKAEGWAGFDGQVDYALEIKLPAGENLDLGALTFLTEFLREGDGRITIPVRVTGPGRRPKISLELGGAEQRAKDAAKDDLEDKVKGFLRGLGGKKGGG